MTFCAVNVYIGGFGQAKSLNLDIRRSWQSLDSNDNPCLEHGVGILR